MSEIDDLLKAGEELVTTPSPRAATRSRGTPKAPPASAGEQAPGDGKPQTDGAVAMESLAESLGPLVESVVSRHVEQLSRELKAVRDDVQSLLDLGGEDEEGMGAVVPQLDIVPKVQTARAAEQDGAPKPPDSEHRDGIEPEKPEASGKEPEATPVAPPPPVTVVNEPAVLEAVTRHALTHFSSMVALLGGMTVLFAYAVGMGYGYILGSGRYPWWSHSFASAFLGAPTGVVLLPLAGWALHVASNEYEEFGRMRPTLRYAGLTLVALGIALPVVSIVLGRV
ncbi:hypothetical protein HAP99_09740 [Acidithiobacillus caldus]|jgi:hypothetical protein|uniref:hypothetical protein n=1 Tax=Acidithiobacillus caldus TaxID=33059 RepID=UPI001C07945B|nr:hypothetical protein [Acidithiobacillus caldus]MBU2783451.1 hypothetical protein [Acidithiobacillus caldus]